MYNLLNHTHKICIGTEVHNMHMEHEEICKYFPQRFCHCLFSLVIQYPEDKCPKSQVIANIVFNCLGKHQAVENSETLKIEFNKKYSTNYDSPDECEWNEKLDFRKFDSTEYRAWECWNNEEKRITEIIKDTAAKNNIYIQFSANPANIAKENITNSSIKEKKALFVVA